MADSTTPHVRMTHGYRRRIGIIGLAAPSGGAHHHDHAVAAVDDLLERLRVALPRVARVRDPLLRPLEAAQHTAVPNEMELEVGPEAPARQLLEGVEVTALERLVAASQEVDVGGHRAASM